MIRLISGTLPKVEFVSGYYLTTLPGEEGLYTRDQPRVTEHRITRVTYRDTVAEEREHCGIPAEATEQEFVFHPEGGLWEYVWTWYEVTCD